MTTVTLPPLSLEALYLANNKWFAGLQDNRHSPLTQAWAI
jgi:hypothetical protein